jgi:hypothetical protein
MIFFAFPFAQALSSTLFPFPLFPPRRLFFGPPLRAKSSPPAQPLAPGTRAPAEALKTSALARVANLLFLNPTPPAP